jgi:PAS domain S-box-containing protein
MLIERLALWTITLVSLIGTVMFGLKQYEASVILLVMGCLTALVYMIRTRAIANTFSQSVFSKKSLRLSAVFQVASEKIETQKSTIDSVIKAIEKIGDGNYSFTDLNLAGEEGEALLKLQTKLTALKEVEEQRVWGAQGIAQISEIRKDNSSLGDYSFQIISHLVKFLGAQQGAFYLLHAEDKQNPYLEQLSAYAYGRRKHAVEKITMELGTGLVGQCALERDMILMTDVPKDYIKITSGLGEALPTCISLMPMLFRGDVFGVIELASFKKFQPFQIEFIKKACETIGLELSGIRSQEHTRKLLEQSQEEELRQNLEEMKATQRAMLVKEEELNQQLHQTQRAMAEADAERKKNEAILEGCMDAVISFNQHGHIEYFNKAAEEVFGISREGILDHDINELLNISITSDNNGSFKIMSATGSEVLLRTEVSTTDSRGEEISLLLTATKVKLEKKHLFTLFAQKVSVELF